MDKQVSPYFGMISIDKVDNMQPDTELSAEKPRDLQLTEQNIKFVHYPDCQQLIIWLPDYYKFYLTIEIKDLHSDQIVFNQMISDIISGSVQIILDTLFIHPGEFEATIKKNNGCIHIVRFKKYPQGQQPDVTESVSGEPLDLDKPPIIYRDGFGNILPNEDLMLRDQILRETYAKITRRLEYVSQGRDGEVIYIEGEKKIRFLMEMGAYECVFYVNIPTESEWEATTGFPLSERDDIVTFVAKQTQCDQASSCVYKISENEIGYYYK